jgi:hypothetical protein
MSREVAVPAKKLFETVPPGPARTPSRDADDDSSLTYVTSLQS